MADEPDLGTDEYADDPGRNQQQYFSGRRTSDPFDEGVRIRKRARHQASRRTLAVRDEEPPSKVQTTKRALEIGNQQAVWELYDERFRGLQQSACKIMAKAWIKLIEPKKQSNHPYTGSDAGAPDWWPKPWGPTKEGRVRHKEPDHLHKHGERESPRGARVGATDGGPPN